MSVQSRWVFSGILLLLFGLMGLAGGSNSRETSTIVQPLQKGGDVVKLLFIHHSVGGDWLAHEYGGLVSELNRQGFYVNDITYGWQPPQLDGSLLARANSRLRDLFGVTPQGADRIGNRTDVGHLYDWFAGPDSKLIMAAVYQQESETGNYGDHANATSAAPLANPGSAFENEVIMIKPCYPNSLYRGDGNDPPTAGDDPPRNFTAGSQQHTVANSKRIYNDILAYFASRPDKFFVIVTGPPRTELPKDGEVAREFSSWLAREWLRENNYRGGNVMVFDLFNVLTSKGEGTGNDLGDAEGNHHRLVDGVEQHQVNSGNNLLVYPRRDGDNHPSPAGLQKATREFVPLFVHHYENWKRNPVWGVAQK